MEKNWIFVKDELPKYGRVVLLRSASGVVQEQTFYRDGGDDGPDWWQDTADQYDGVTINPGDSWMPLPPSTPSTN